MSPKPGQEGPSRLDMLKVWLLDPRSRIAVRRRLAEVRITRRSVLAAGMAVWLLYAALVWQFGGRRLEGCTSLTCRVLLGGLPFGRGDAAPPAAAAGSASPTPSTGHVVLPPGTAPTSSAATTTTTTTPFVALALLPSTTGASPPTAGEPTSTTAPASTAPGPTTTTSAGTSTTVPQPRCKPKKHRECKPKEHPKRMYWWWRWPMAVLGRGR